MKTTIRFSLLITILAVVTACSSSKVVQLQSPEIGESDRQLASFSDDRIGCPDVIELSDYTGVTYLNFMQTVVKPKLDNLAIKGYTLADGKQVKKTLKAVDYKVSKKAIRGTDGEGNLLELANALSGVKVNLYDLPDAIADVSYDYDKYNLSTFLGLASCGGAIIKYADYNYAYNIHYGTGKVSKDDRTGRSFGAGPERKANDASDKAYLTDLQAYVTETEDLTPFYKTLLEALVNSDPAGYAQISNEGQALLTDFLAVYTAEQDRNLMDGKIHPHWDAALMEVTLLSAFHAGQDEIALLFKSPEDGVTTFTNTVVNQAPGGEPRTKKRKASLIDYWQFSSNPAPESKNRSGINITREQFRTLGAKVTEFERTKNKKLVERIEKLMPGTKKGGNVFQKLGQYLINSSTKKNLGSKGYELAEAFAELLVHVRADAKEISSSMAMVTF